MKIEQINGKKYIYKKEDIIIEVIYEIEQNIIITNFWVNEIRGGIKVHMFGIRGKLKEKEIKEYIEVIKTNEYIKYFYQVINKIENIEE